MGRTTRSSGRGRLRPAKCNDAVACCDAALDVRHELPSTSTTPRGRAGRYAPGVITCVVEYVIDPTKIEAFERFAHRWMELVDLHGGVHHGYFLPAEGASDRAMALFSFPNLATYEQYRERFGSDADFIAADQIRDESGCVLRYDRTFMRPLLPPR